MGNAIRLNEVRSGEVQGISASIMYALPEGRRSQVLDLIADGLSTDEALEVIADGVAKRTDRVIEAERSNANPFRTP